PCILCFVFFLKRVCNYSKDRSFSLAYRNLSLKAGAKILRYFLPRKQFNKKNQSFSLHFPQVSTK
ncbi:MAG: hypothetical protein LBB62_08550, partial [Proteiniphilum sp.]|nr:hypothetical protein [Proteiniphilum sp.]